MFTSICSTAKTSNYSYSLISAAALFFLSLIVFPQLLPNASFAEPASVTPSLTIGNSGTLAFSVNPGQFNSGNQTITVETTNYTGYTLTIAPASGTSTDLVNSTTNTTIPSVTSNTKQSAFSSASYGFTIDGTITSNTEYKPVTNGATIKQTGSAGTDSICLTIGAKAESNTAAGVYQKQFTLTATANAVAYSITYNANAGSDTVANMPTSPQTSGSVSGTDLTLASEVPERTGYNFLGWSTNSSATTVTYAAGGTYSLDQTTSNQVTLYAVWEAKTYTITIKTVTGISKVTLNSTECTSTSGCSVSGLKYNTAYNLVATVATGYSFSSWNAGSYGSIASTSSASTTYTVGAGASTITPSATANNYTCTKRYALQNADGTYPSYTTDTTEQVEYGATCSYSKSVTDYQTQSTSGTMTENGLTLSLDLPRNTYTLTINRNSTYISAVSGAGAKRWGEEVSISATVSSGQFNGWSQTSGTTGTFADATSASTTFTMPKSDATIYADGKSAIESAIVTFDQAYAAAGKTKYNGYYKMQDMNSTICNAVTTGQTGTVIDARDNQTYRIAKWKMSADGSSATCWMKDNLNLGAKQLTVNLTSSNTNISSTITASTFNSWIKSSGTGSYTSPELIPVTASNASNGLAADSYGNKYGTLYNYAAASANTINAASGANNDDASNSLCPYGWRLPTGGSSGEFQAFYNANSPTVTTMQSDYGFSLAGRFISSTPNYQDSYGIYWSSTRTNGNNMYRLYFVSSNVNPASSGTRYGGNSVRCISL